jgi:hypothetical protein
VAGCCEHGDEHLGSINYGEFLDRTRNCWFNKIGSLLRGIS